MEKNKCCVAKSIVIGAISGAVAAAAVIGVYVFLKSEKGQACVGKVKDGAKCAAAKIKAKLPRKVTAETADETVVLEEAVEEAVEA
jgi:hypothetical protein